jgi:phosphopantetheine--protein transferase-like protein
MTHAFIYWLEDTGAPLDALVHRLTVTDREELKHVRLPQKTRSFILSRLMLRHLLREQLPHHSGIGFDREKSGRLVLTGTTHWHISLSHCAGRVAVMLAEAPCGIDIEGIREIDWRRISTRYFSHDEQAWLQSQPATEAGHAFLRLWTLKEAGVKALGKGLANHLARLAFDVSGNEPHVVASSPWHGMSLHQVMAGEHLLAAAIMTAPPVNWQLHQLTIEALCVSA